MAPPNIPPNFTESIEKADLQMGFKTLIKWKESQDATSQGQLDLSAEVDVAITFPPPLSLLPGFLLRQACGLVLKAASSTILPRFGQLVAEDYRRWSRNEARFPCRPFVEPAVRRRPLLRVDPDRQADASERLRERQTDQRRTCKLTLAARGGRERGGGKERRERFPTKRNGGGKGKKGAGCAGSNGGGEEVIQPVTRTSRRKNNWSCNASLSAATRHHCRSASSNSSSLSSSISGSPGSGIASALRATLETSRQYASCFHTCGYTESNEGSRKVGGRKQEEAKETGRREEGRGRRKEDLDEGPEELQDVTGRAVQLALPHICKLHQDMKNMLNRRWDDLQTSLYSLDITLIIFLPVVQLCKSRAVSQTAGQHQRELE
eukprot:747852-Hanusia_phi.AAC.5